MNIIRHPYSSSLGNIYILKTISLHFTIHNKYSKQINRANNNLSSQFLN